MAERERGWFIGCGTCGGNLHVRNASVVRIGPTCDHCIAFGTPADGELDVADHLVSTELGWCACGSPEQVDEMMHAYLRARSHDDWPKPSAEGVSEDAEMLLAYIADDLGWTEHGSNVGGAWLTTDGQEALTNLAAARARRAA